MDSIRAVFEFADGLAIELYEAMEGWDSLVDELPTYLPGCRKSDEWFKEVAFPPFEYNLTVLYEREVEKLG